MKILHWTDGFAPRCGGIETLLDDLTRAQRDAGHEVSVVAHHDFERSPAQEKIDGIQIHRLRWYPHVLTNDLTGLRDTSGEAAELKRALAPDILHLHLAGQLGMLHLLTRGAWKAPEVVTVHAPPGFVQLPPPMVARLLRESQAVAFVSKAMQALWSGQVPGLRNGGHVIANGVRKERLLEVPPPTGKPMVLFFGRLDPMKGLSVGLEAFARVLTRIPEATLVIAGDGPERARLEEQARQLEIAESVQFAGWVGTSDLPQLLAKSHLVIVPSQWEEPFGLVAAEAQMAGRPVVASDVGALREIVSAETGALVPKADPDAFAEAMGHLLEDPALARRAGEKGRTRALERFEFQRCSGEYQQLYGRLLAGSRLPT